MNEADAIMSSIQAVMEHVSAEFSQADVAGGHWAGVDTDARLRLARRIREEVNRLTEVFERVRATIAAAPGGDLASDELERRIAQQQRELAQLTAADAALQAACEGAARPGSDGDCARDR